MITSALKTALLSNLIVSDLDMVLVRMTPGATHAEGLAAMRQAARAGDRAYAALPNDEGGGVSMAVLPVQYPAEIINYRSIGDTPVLLAMGFAVGVAGAFAFTVVASVRRRRRDLALLKTLGFTRRQLSACIAWQSSASVLTGLVIGIPLGIVIGRWLWLTFAREIYAVPSATIPTLVTRCPRRHCDGAGERRRVLPRSSGRANGRRRGVPIGIGQLLRTKHQSRWRRGGDSTGPRRSDDRDHDGAEADEYQGCPRHRWMGNGVDVAGEERPEFTTQDDAEWDTHHGADDSVHGRLPRHGGGESFVS